MINLEMTAHSTEEGTGMELFREILHAVIVVRSQHHFQLLRVDLTVLIHHEICGSGGFKIEAVIGAIGIAKTQKMAELMRAFLLESVTVGALTDRNDPRVGAGPV